VVGRKGQALVFSREGEGVEYSAPVTVLGCLTSRQRPVALLRFEEGESPGFDRLVGPDPVFAGPYVAFALTVVEGACGKYTGGGPQCEQHRLGSYDLRTGRPRARASSAAEALVVTAQGWIAWIEPAGDALRAIDSHGGRVLDPGPVDPHSLAVSGQTVLWTSVGTPHSAQLN
jgi:hypothetical protein